MKLNNSEKGTIVFALEQLVENYEREGFVPNQVYELLWKVSNNVEVAQ